MLKSIVYLVWRPSRPSRNFYSAKICLKFEFFLKIKVGFDVLLQTTVAVPIIWNIVRVNISYTITVVIFLFYSTSLLMKGLFTTGQTNISDLWGCKRGVVLHEACSEGTLTGIFRSTESTLFPRAERSWRGGPNYILTSRNSRLLRPEPAKRLIREQDDSNIIMEESRRGCPFSQLSL